MESALIFRSVQTARDARLIFIGDIHGCYDELRELLDKVAPAPDDVVVAVGDVVTKGPAAGRCLELWRARHYLAVRGNNEMKLLEKAHPILRFFARANRDVLSRGDLLRYIASWPLVLDFPDANISVVHGGFLPGMRVSEADVSRERDVISKLRWIRKRNGGWMYVPKDKKRKDDSLWAEQWNGPRFIVYGHTPLREPRLDKNSLGLDTGCVYGGSLTAAIYANGSWSFATVDAHQRYAG